MLAGAGRESQKVGTPIVAVPVVVGEGVAVGTTGMVAVVDGGAVGVSLGTGEPPGLVAVGVCDGVDVGVGVAKEVAVEVRVNVAGAVAVVVGVEVFVRVGVLE